MGVVEVDQGGRVGVGLGEGITPRGKRSRRRRLVGATPPPCRHVATIVSIPYNRTIMIISFSTFLSSFARSPHCSLHHFTPTHTPSPSHPPSLISPPPPSPSPSLPLPHPPSLSLTPPPSSPSHYPTSPHRLHQAFLWGHDHERTQRRCSQLLLRQPPGD